MPQTFYARQDGTNAVRQLTAAQIARLVHDASGTVYADPTGAITGHVFVSPASDGQVYSLVYDRWFDPTTIPAGMTPEQFFATQPEAGTPREEAAQWWQDEVPAPVALPEAAPVPAADVEAPAVAAAPATPAPAAPETPAPETPMAPHRSRLLELLADARRELEELAHRMREI